MEFLFFFQAEDGIRDADVTGVQPCALPFSRGPAGATGPESRGADRHRPRACPPRAPPAGRHAQDGARVPQALRLVHEGRGGGGWGGGAALSERWGRATRSQVSPPSHRREPWAGGGWV